jgi:hypothetical protein
VVDNRFSIAILCVEISATLVYKFDKTFFIFIVNIRAKVSAEIMLKKS